jgi:hypothetical protein
MDLYVKGEIYHPYMLEIQINFHQKNKQQFFQFLIFLYKRKQLL